MTHEEYSKLNGLNWSLLKLLRDKSPLHYQHAKKHGTPDSTGRALGRASHALVFEPDTFYATHAVYEGARRAGKDYDAFVAANPGKEILKRSEVADLLDQAEAVRTSPLLQDYLNGGKFEQTVTWTDPATGLPCKARLDWINPRTRTLIDLKGTPTVHPLAFGKRAAKDGYHIQLGGHYFNACKYGLGWEPEEVAIVAVEFNRPFDVAVFTLEGDDLELAQYEIALLLEKAKECLDTDTWPGHAPVKERISLPGWAWGSEEDDVDELEEMGFKSEEEE